MPYNPELKRLRVRSCLSQGELADLVGVSQARICRYEKNEEAPSLSSAFGLQVIFDRPPRALFQHVYAHVEDEVMRRGAELERSLIGKTDYASMRKRHLLESMMERATKRERA
jgi:transcriptional regulator with XRE-family HTH domain